MKRTHRKSKGRVMNPTFFVFCEGETEEAFIKHQRSLYRLPIQIISKISDSNISNKFIESYKTRYGKHPKDKTFLMFDLDVEGMFERLRTISDATLLCSNPCCELWFQLHYADHNMEITTSECIHKFKQQEPQYKKGTLTQSLKARLAEQYPLAKQRAERLTPYINPSTTIFRFIEELEKVKAAKEK